MQYHLLQGNIISKTFLEIHGQEIMFKLFRVYLHVMGFRQDIIIIIWELVKHPV